MQAHELGGTLSERRQRTSARSDSHLTQDGGISREVESARRVPALLQVEGEDACVFVRRQGGLHAIRLDSGERAWFTPPQPPLCGSVQGCSATQSAAVTAIPGAVFSGSADGGLRAYSATDGAIIWTFNANRRFDTVNGVEASGASFDGPGVTVAGGMVYAVSGNAGFVGRPGDVLLAFAIGN